MFKKANPDSKMPAVLQKNTKENIIFQTTLVVVFLAVTFTKERLALRKWEKQLEQDGPYTPVA